MRFEEVKRADGEGVQALSALATSIVREHFDPIIGKAQNDYMLEKFQSVPALRSQLESGTTTRHGPMSGWGLSASARKRTTSAQASAWTTLSTATTCKGRKKPALHRGGSPCAAPVFCGIICARQRAGARR